MWMSELSTRSGVPVPTIKYYLREELLPGGEAVSATRARYDEGHLERLRLIRALVQVAGMRLDRVRRVLAAVDDANRTLGSAIGSAHTELSPEPDVDPSKASTSRVAELVRSRRWRVEADGRHARALAGALDVMAEAGQPLPDATLEAYVDAAATMAMADLANLPDRSRDNATTYAVIGTVLAEPVILSLRRLAQENLARRRLGRRSSATSATRRRNAKTRS